MDSVMDDEVTEEVQKEPRGGGLRRRAPALLVLVAVVLALAVWGFLVRPHQRSSLDASLQPVTPDPCSLVDRDELVAILGPIGDPEERPGMGAFPEQRACMIPRPGGSVPAAIVGVLGANDPIALRDDHPQFQGGLDMIEGIGDEAGWMARFRVFLVVKDRSLLTVQIVDFQGLETARERAEKVAALAVGRL